MQKVICRIVVVKGFIVRVRVKVRVTFSLGQSRLLHNLNSTNYLTHSDIHKLPLANLLLEFTFSQCCRS